jgi:hypothetical protein
LEQSAKTKNMILAHGTYTKPEWKAFIRKMKSEKGFFSRLIHFFSSMLEKKVPEVTITQRRVWLNEDFQYFNDDGNQLRGVRVHEKGNLNILEITYEPGKNKRHATCKISLPVPKGKLKEAFAVEEKLISAGIVNQQG